MSNNHDYRGSSYGRGGSSSRKRRKKKTTGRFYAVVAAALIIVVALCVGLPKLFRGSGTKPASASNDTSGTDAQTVSTTSGDTSDTSETSGTTSIADLIESDNDLAPLEGSDKVQTESDLNVNTDLPTNWENILLLGTDSRNKDKVSRTDTMIIASINADEGRVKLISIMRDMIVEIPGHDEQKMNACVYFGGPELLMQILNEKLHMNITKYVMVNFYSFQHVIDLIGGVDVDITEEEMERINSALGEAAKASGMDQSDWNREEAELKTYGTLTHLNGMQALSYARIRHIDSDFQRTERQRTILNAVLQKVKSSNMNFTQISKIGKEVLSYVDTNIDVSSAVVLAASVLNSGIGDLEEARMPCKDSYTSATRANTAGTRISALWDIDYEKNAQVLYTYIYGNGS